MKVNLKKPVKSLQENYKKITEELKKIGGPQFSTDLREQWLDFFRKVKEYFKEKKDGTTAGLYEDDES